MTAPYTAAELAAISADFHTPYKFTSEYFSASGIRLVAELTRAREALRPFAKEADSYDPDDGDGPYRAWASNFTVEQLRAARAALGDAFAEATASKEEPADD